MNKIEKIVLPTLCFLDVETTGLSARYNDRICEIAILRKASDGKISKWHSLINPDRPISPCISAIHGITNEMVADHPKFYEVAEEILEFIRNSVIVCHNAPFDLGFLNAEFDRCDLSMPKVEIIDTLKIARKHFNFPSNSLGNIANHLNIKQRVRHRALADVYTTSEIFNWFCTQLDPRTL